MSKCKKVLGAVKNRNKKFELASQKETKKLDEYVDKVVHALIKDSALVTDESYVSDFLTIFCDEPEKSKRRANELKRASKKLGIEIVSDELVIDVAKRLMDEKMLR
jgi:hypothetical protein